MYTYSRVTSICIDLSKIKLFVFVFVFVRRFTVTYLSLYRYDEQHINSTRYGNSYENNISWY